MRAWRRRAVLALVLLLGAWPALAGHEIPYYPSFYPQEIALERVEPAAAAKLLAGSRIQAYVGADPFEGVSPPAHVGYAESLAGWLVLTFEPRAPALADARARCAAAGAAVRAAATVAGRFTFAPYPVTPFHEEYLGHFDL
ncbi:MAG TPA: hypothetical protein VFX28_12135, partial [Methylomirabilota bacterium]|nr:hypothetical protein [Methylomirabilota bacterium]